MCKYREALLPHIVVSNSLTATTSDFPVGCDDEQVPVDGRLHIMIHTIHSVRKLQRDMNTAVSIGGYWGQLNRSIYACIRAYESLLFFGARNV